MTTSERFDPCNLPEDELQARIRMIRAEILPHARGTDELPNGIAWEFDGGADLRVQLEQLVEFERRCCSGLSWNLEEVPGCRLRLVVEGADPATLRAAIAGLEGSTEPRSFLRILKAGGLGFAGAFFAFCVLPIAAVALLGGAVAGPLLGLDDPWLVAAGSLVFGGLIFWFGRRRAQQS